MKISIIAQVYNDKEYLQGWFDSVMAQTFTDFELIIVDDGSTDGSHELCEEFAKQDSRVRLFTQRNGGIAAARNLGILNAEGEYITFVDSDDLVDDDYLEVLYQNLIKYDADISIVAFKRYQESEQTFYSYLNADTVGLDVLTPKQAVEWRCDYPYNEITFITLWAKLYKRSLFVGELLPEHIIYEDEAFTHRLYLRANKIVSIRENHYVYRIRPNGVITSTVTDERIQSLITAFRIKLMDLAGAGIATELPVSRFMNSLRYLVDHADPEIKDKPGYIEAMELLKTRELKSTKDDAD